MTKLYTFMQQKSSVVRIARIGIKPELIQNYYNWYIAIDPVSGDYVIDADIEAATQKARQQHLDSIPCLFRINETGVCGTI